MNEYNTFLEQIKIPDIKENPLDYTLKIMKDKKENGLVLEFGVFRGDTIRRIGKVFNDRIVYGFDSFEGLPESWGRPDKRFDKGAFGMNKELPKVEENVKLIDGWFEETLPEFCKEHKEEKIIFMHIDCDIYSSTKCIFENTKKMLGEEVYIVFDELVNYPTYEKHEILAFYEFIKENKEYEYEIIGMNGKYDKNIKKENGARDQSVAIRIIKKKKFF